MDQIHTKAAITGLNVLRITETDREKLPKLKHLICLNNITNNLKTTFLNEKL